MKVHHLNPFQIRAIYDSWASIVLWDYHPGEHGIDLATRIAEVGEGRSSPTGESIYEAFFLLEDAGIGYPGWRRESWESDRRRWGVWLQVVHGPRERRW